VDLRLRVLVGAGGAGKAGDRPRRGGRGPVPARTALAVAGVALAVGTLTAACSSGSSSRSGTTGTGSGSASAAVWGFAGLDVAAAPVGTAVVPPAALQSGSWRGAADAATAGRKATVTRLSTGRYRVLLPAVGVAHGAGVALASPVTEATAATGGAQPAAAAAVARCHSETWDAAGPDEAVVVGCRGADGRPVDALFSTLFTYVPPGMGAGGSGPYAYFRLDEPTAGTTRPVDRFSSAGADGVIEVHRTGVGNYSIDVVGKVFARPGNNYQVNAVGDTSVGCNALGRVLKADRQTLFVGCADGARPTDSRFAIVYGNQHGMLPIADGSFGYAFTGQSLPGGKIVQPPLGAARPTWARYSSNSGGGADVVIRQGVGRYLLILPGVARTPDLLQVTPYGEATARCAASRSKPAPSAPGDTLVMVTCAGPGGQPMDSFVSLAYASAAAAPAAPAPRPGTVTTVAAGTGRVLADVDGRALYLYTADAGGASTCTAVCASAWPPATTSGTPRAGDGVTASLLGTTSRPDGTSQITYGGHPLYYYAGDDGPGTAAGQGAGGAWFTVAPSGDQVNTG